MQGFRARATAGREEGLPQSPPQRPRRSRRSAYIPAAVPRFPDAPFPAAPKPRCLVVPLPRCPVRLLPPPSPPTPVPQNRPFWSPEPGKTHLRAPKPAFLGSRARKNSPPYPKTGHFGVPKPEIQRCRWAKQTFLPIRGWENTLSLGKTGIFAHQRVGKAEPDSRKWRVWAGGMSSRGAQGIQSVTQGVGLKIFLREM